MKIINTIGKCQTFRQNLNGLSVILNVILHTNGKDFYFNNITFVYSRKDFAKYFDIYAHFVRRMYNFHIER